MSEEVSGLGRLLSWARWVGCSGEVLFPFFVSVVFYYLIFCHCFEFKQISNSAKTSSGYFYVASWTFPEAHKLSQSI